MARLVRSARAVAVEAYLVPEGRATALTVVLVILAEGPSAMERDWELDQCWSSIVLSSVAVAVAVWVAEAKATVAVVVLDHMATSAYKDHSRPWRESRV